MSRQDLQAKYGGNARNAINRAIRAEVPGGGELLDTIELASHLNHHQRLPSTLMAKLQSVRDAMAAHVIGSPNGKPRSQGPGQGTKRAGDLKRSVVAIHAPARGEPAISPAAPHPSTAVIARAKPAVIPAMGARPAQTVGDAAHFGERPRLPAEMVAKLGTIADATIAAEAGKSETFVREERERLGVAAYRPRWTEDALRLLDAEPDNAKVSAATGFTVAAVKVQRSRRKAKQSSPG